MRVFEMNLTGGVAQALHVSAHHPTLNGDAGGVWEAIGKRAWWNINILEL